MEPANPRVALGVVLDTSILIGAERRHRTVAQIIEGIHATVGQLPAVLSPITIAEIGHGIYRANSPEIRARRCAFLDELKATIPVPPITDATAEIVARIGGEQAALGINLALSDLLIAACALELGYSIATANVRDFNRIPGLSVIPLA